MTAEVTGATKGRRMRGSAGILRVLSDTMLAVRPHRRLLWLLCGFSVLSALAESMLLFIVARLAVAAAGDADRVDITFGPLPTNDLSIRDASIVALVLVVVALALAYPVARLVGVMSRRTLVHLRTTLLGAYLAAPWAERAKDPEGHLQEFVSEYSHRVERIVTAGTVILVGGLSTLVLTIYAFFVAPLASLGLVAGLFVLAFALRPTTKRVKRGSLSFVQANRRLASQVAQTSRVSQEITAFDVAHPVTESLRDDIETSGTLIGQIRFAATFVPMLYQYVALGLVVSMIGILAVTSPGALAAVAPILLLFIRALGYGRQIQARTQEGVELSPYLEAIELEIARLQASMPPRPERTASEFEALTFERVGFAYPGGSSVLDEVSFELRRGDALGVVGPSGAGKSTLMQLLLRLREPTSGRITIDGVDVREIDPAAWARLVAFVPQDNKLIRGTVADNIAFYRAGFTRAEVERAAHEAHLHADLTGFPDGYDTMIGPGERDLSGGQRQRLGIARALVGHPEVLVLDEPTSALDSTSEQLVRQTLQELKGRTTLVIIAHRPGILEVCDRQATVGDGAVDITPSHVDGTAAATP